MTMLQGTKEGVYKNIDVSSSMNDPSARTTGMEMMRKATRLLMRELSVAVEGLNMLPGVTTIKHFCQPGLPLRGQVFCCGFFRKGKRRLSFKPGLTTVDDQFNGDYINGFDQIDGQKGYDDHLYVVNNGFLTNYFNGLAAKYFAFGQSMIHCFIFTFQCKVPRAISMEFF